MEDSNIPFGYCHCGCGQRTSIAQVSSTRKGHVRGQPVRFICGHNGVKSTGPRYIIDTSGCWIWQRTQNQHGYGTIRGKIAHRVIYEEIYGPLADGLELDHLCRNRACVNPNHLEPVSHAVNMQRGRTARLTKEAVDQIRNLRAQGIDAKVIAEQFGVTHRHVRKIVSKACWRDE